MITVASPASTALAETALRGQGQHPEPASIGGEWAAQPSDGKGHLGTLVQTYGACLLGEYFDCILGECVPEPTPPRSHLLCRRATPSASYAGEGHLVRPASLVRVRSTYDARGRNRCALPGLVIAFLLASAAFLGGPIAAAHAQGPEVRLSPPRLKSEVIVPPSTMSRPGDTGKTSTQFTATWSPPSSHGSESLTGYGIMLRAEGASWPKHATRVLRPGTTSTTFTGLTPNSIYWFRVHACNGPGSCGSWSPQASVTLPPETSPPPDDDDDTDSSDNGNSGGGSTSTSTRRCETQTIRQESTEPPIPGSLAEDNVILYGYLIEHRKSHNREFDLWFVESQTTWCFENNSIVTIQMDSDSRDGTYWIDAEEFQILHVRNLDDPPTTTHGGIRRSYHEDSTSFEINVWHHWRIACNFINSPDEVTLPECNFDYYPGRGPTDDEGRGRWVGGRVRKWQRADGTSGAGPLSEDDDSLTRSVRSTAAVSNSDRSDQTTQSDGARLLLQSDFNVYLNGRKSLTYIKIDDCTATDLSRRFFLRVYPVHISDLPADRQSIGYENFDFGFADGARADSGHCFLAHPLPSYAIRAIDTGQYTSNTRNWEAETPGVFFEILDGSELAVSSDFGVLWKRNQLVYMKGSCSEADTRHDFFIHVHPVNAEDLPASRRWAGYEAFEFNFADNGTRVGDHCVAAYPLPTYPIQGFVTGQRVSGSDRRVWSGADAVSPVDYDADDDGLIEVANLAQLTAIRWDLDGDGASTDTGYADAYPHAMEGKGCPVSGCTGYELVGDLDFRTAGAAFWNSGKGWEPLGTSGTKFAATFDGNGHAIANLYIHRGDDDGVGMFGWTGATSEIRNVGLRNVRITGDQYSGGLVGRNDGGTITASFASGRVVSDNHDVGGLVGWSSGPITASYAAVDVTGYRAVGGLAGYHEKGAITASYATGQVTATSSESSSHGGLVGYLGRDGSLRTSYAVGAVRGVDHVGGLIGGKSGTVTVTASYWDTATSGQASSAGGTGQTTSALQAPNGYTGLYADWNVDLDGDSTTDDPWDFGTTTEYPVLQVDVNGDGTASWAEFGDQRPAPAANRIDYDADDDGLIEVATLAQLTAIRWDLDGNGVTTDAGYAAAFPRPLPGMGCRTGCTGYELTGDLDFATAGPTYWNRGAGWDPIGGTYTGIFDGNGHVIANLVISRASTDEVGLFQRLGPGGVLRNLGLRAVNVTGDDKVGSWWGAMTAAPSAPATPAAASSPTTTTWAGWSAGARGRSRPATPPST